MWWSAISQATGARAYMLGRTHPLQTPNISGTAVIISGHIDGSAAAFAGWFICVAGTPYFVVTDGEWGMGFHVHIENAPNLVGNTKMPSYPPKQLTHPQPPSPEPPARAAGVGRHD